MDDFPYPPFASLPLKMYFALPSFFSFSLFLLIRFHMQRGTSLQTDGVAHTSGALFSHISDSFCVDTQAWLFGRGRNPAKVTGHLTPPTDLMSHDALISIVNFTGRKRDDTQSDSLCRT